jgi:DNA-binding transcriptional ArsR family regulator
MATDAAELGRRILDKFAEGRALAIRGRRLAGSTNARAIRAALDDDLLAGHPDRGRARRIAQRTGLSRRTVSRHLGALLSVSQTDTLRCA